MKKGTPFRRCPLQNARYWFGARPQDKVPRENGRISFGTNYGGIPETNSERYAPHIGCACVKTFRQNESRNESRTPKTSPETSPAGYDLRRRICTFESINRISLQRKIPA